MGTHSSVVYVWLVMAVSFATLYHTVHLCLLVSFGLCCGGLRCWWYYGALCTNLRCHWHTPSILALSGSMCCVNVFVVSTWGPLGPPPAWPPLHQPVTTTPAARRLLLTNSCITAAADGRSILAASAQCCGACCHPPCRRRRQPLPQACVC